MKTILVPVDYSAGAKNALLFALELAQKNKLKVVVFHVFNAAAAPSAVYEVPFFLPAIEKEKLYELEQFVKESKESMPQDSIYDFRCAANAAKAATQAPGYTEQVFHTIVAASATRDRYAARVTCVVKMGTVIEQILRVAEAHAVDMVVMGMQGGGALGQAIIGSTTVSVMRTSPVPVLGIPLKATYRRLKSAVFASDLSRQPDVLLLRLLRSFMLTFRPRLEVLHLHHQPDLQVEFKNVERALEVFDEQLHDIDYRVVLRQRPEVVAGIKEYLQDRQVNVLILSPQQHTFLERFLNKSVTAKMVAHNEVPLLTLPSSRAGWQKSGLAEVEAVTGQ